MNIENLTTGEQLAIWRKRNKIPQRIVADYVGVHLTTISKIENEELWNAEYSIKYNQFIREHEEKKKVK